MSSGDVDYLHIRLKEELGRLSLSMADAARLIGEKDSQGIRDSCSGRKRITAELLAKLAAIGVDASYVLAGPRADSQQVHQVNQDVRPYGLSDDESALVAAYRRSPQTIREAALRMLNAEVQPTGEMPEGLQMKKPGEGEIPPVMRSGTPADARGVSRKKKGGEG